MLGLNAVTYRVDSKKIENVLFPNSCPKFHINTKPTIRSKKGL